MSKSSESELEEARASADRAWRRANVATLVAGASLLVSLASIYLTLSKFSQLDDRLTGPWPFEFNRIKARAIEVTGAAGTIRLEADSHTHIQLQTPLPEHSGQGIWIGTSPKVTSVSLCGSTPERSVELMISKDSPFVSVTKDDKSQLLSSTKLGAATTSSVGGRE